MATDDVLRAIVGEQLSSVEFVQNYVQLHFDGPTLTILSYPMLLIEGERYVGETPGYRDLLCGQIAKQVKIAALVDNEEICIAFDNGVEIVIPLTIEDDRIPEAAMFQDSVGGSLTIWP